MDLSLFLIKHIDILLGILDELDGVFLPYVDKKGIQPERRNPWMLKSTQDLPKGYGLYPPEEDLELDSEASRFGKAKYTKICLL